MSSYSANRTRTGVPRFKSVVTVLSMVSSCCISGGCSNEATTLAALERDAAQSTSGDSDAGPDAGTDSGEHVVGASDGNFGGSQYRDDGFSSDLPVSDGNDPFPPDFHDDDRLGLVVMGLNGEAAVTVVSPWLVVTRMFRNASVSAPLGDGQVELARYAENFPVSEHLDHFDVSLDRCQLISSGPENGDRAVNNPPPPSIHGGQTVIINSPSGPWYSYRSRTGVDGQLTYEATDELPGALPALATLSIPGDAFPNVAAYPLYEPEPVQRIEPAIATAVTAESHLRWVAGQGNTRIKIDWLVFDENDRFQSFAMSCLARDDGEFLPQAEFREALAGLEDQLRVRFSRVYARLDIVDGIVFYQQSEVAE